METTLHISSSVLAFFTTVHLAFVVLRADRSPETGSFSFITVISLLLAATPWLLPTPIGLAVGLLAQVAWWGACERLLPVHLSSQTVTAPVAKRTPAPVAPVAKIRTPAPTAAAPRVVATLLAPERKRIDFVQTPVLSVVEETPTIRTFRMARPDGFEFKAGQFLPVRVRAEGGEHVRCYSISSAPEMRGYLEISVRRMGLVSGALHATLRPGSMLAVKNPLGAFVYPTGEDRPLVFIAGGVGITPLMSMVRHALATEPMRPVTLLYSVRTEAEIAFRDEIHFLERRSPQFRAFVAVTEGHVAEGYFPGHINETLVQTMVPDVAHATCMICGPRPMLDAMTAMLVEIGVQRAQVHFEIFEAAVAAAAAASTPAAGVPTPGAGAPPPAAALTVAVGAVALAVGVPTAAAAESVGYQTQFTSSGVTVSVTPDQTLLEASEACGAGIPSLCRAGVCGTCRTRVIEGDVECTSSVLDDQDRQDGFVLACVAHVKSDCVVEA